MIKESSQNESTSNEKKLDFQTIYSEIFKWVWKDAVEDYIKNHPEKFKKYLTNKNKNDIIKSSKER